MAKRPSPPSKKKKKKKMTTTCQVSCFFSLSDGEPQGTKTGPQCVSSAMLWLFHSGPLGGANVHQIRASG